MRRGGAHGAEAVEQAGDDPVAALAVGPGQGRGQGGGDGMGRPAGDVLGGVPRGRQVAGGAGQGGRQGGVGGERGERRGGVGARGRAGAVGHQSPSPTGSRTAWRAALSASSVSTMRARVRKESVLVEAMSKP